jgi:hypothetical protein
LAKKSPATLSNGLSNINGTNTQLSPNERAHWIDKPAQNKHITVKIRLEKSTSRLMYLSISACLLEAL